MTSRIIMDIATITSLVWIMVRIVVPALGSLVPILLATALPLMAANVHVAKTGNDGNSGATNSPYLTVQKAVDVANGGDTIWVATGIYNEEVGTRRNGTSGGRIVVNGQGVATLKKLTLMHQYHSLINFEFTGVTNLNKGHVVFSTNAYFNIVSNNWIHVNATNEETGEFTTTYQSRGISFDLFGDGYVTNSPGQNLCISNLITDVTGAAAIHTWGGTNTFTGNDILHIGSADFWRLFGIKMIIQHGRYLTNFAVGGLGYHADMFQVFGNNGYPSQDHIIEGNVMGEGVMGMMQLEDPEYISDGITNIIAKNWTFRNNIWVRISNGASVGIPGIKFYNDLFYEVNNSGHVLAFSYADCEVFDCVFLDCGDSSKAKGWYTTNSAAIADFIADYNYVGKNGYGAVDTGTTRSNSRFKEDHGVNGGDPKFVDASTLDFRLAEATSVLKGAGVSLSGVTVDFAGVSRPQNSDFEIGPYEFAGDVEGGGGPPPEPPPPDDVIQTVKIRFGGKVRIGGKVVIGKL